MNFVNFDMTVPRENIKIVLENDIVDYAYQSTGFSITVYKYCGGRKNQILSYLGMNKIQQSNNKYLI